jgi:glycerol-3-phosphate dehydrogenase (NAD(P)+)
MKEEQISILGAGSWGNTLAFLYGQNHKVILWDHNPSRVRRANRTRRFKKPIVQKYPDNVSITNDLSHALQSRIIINAISLKGMTEVFIQVRKFNLDRNAIIVNAAKGIDSLNLQTPSEIIQEFCPNNPIAILSGPNLSRELIKGKPMVTEIASLDTGVTEFLKEQLSNPILRIYTNTDVKGVELCAALKNVIAIAAGVVDALKLGESAKASLITRGLHEIGKLLALYDCKPETLLGPAGIGDLIATCACDLSRNYRVGYLLAEGKKLDNIINKLGEVARAVYQICKENDLQLPIVEQIKKLVDNEITAVEAVLALMSRGR